MLGLSDLGPETHRKPTCTDFLVLRIGGPLSEIRGHCLKKVTDVVQQGRDDERSGCSLLTREMRRLQGVLGHRYALAEVRRRAGTLEEGENLARDAHGR